jgi:hypothetical protein
LHAECKMFFLHEAGLELTTGLNHPKGCRTSPDDRVARHGLRGTPGASLNGRLPLTRAAGRFRRPLAAAATLVRPRWEGTNMKRLVALLVVAAAATVGTAAAAGAEKPGPGDKQCVPGQNGNPHPGHKAGVCTNP